MKSNNEIEKHIKRAVNTITPDIFEKICEIKSQEEDGSMENSNNKATNVSKVEFKEKAITKKRTPTFVKVFAGVAAMCAIVVSGIFYSENYMVDSLIAIDINPSMELLTNKSDKVIKATPLNEDADKVLDEMDLKGVDMDVAVNAIIGSMVKNGYIHEDQKSSILVSVENKNTEKAEQIQASVVSDIDTSLKDNNVAAKVLDQKISVDKEIEKLAKANNISYGKASFINSVIAKDSNLTFEQLAPLSIEEISRLAESGGVNLHEIVNFGNHKACSLCSPDCTCDECDDEDGGCDEYCDECSPTCKNHISKRPATVLGKPCSLCSPDCTCEECSDDDGCDKGCEDCSPTCKNYRAAGAPALPNEDKDEDLDDDKDDVDDVDDVDDKDDEDDKDDKDDVDDKDDDKDDVDDKDDDDEDDDDKDKKPVKTETNKNKVDSGSKDKNESKDKDSSKDKNESKDKGSSKDKNESKDKDDSDDNDSDSSDKDDDDEDDD